MKKISLVWSLIILLTSCSSSQMSLTEAMNLLNGTWTLQSLNGQSELTTLFSNQLPSLQFDTQAMRISGSDGCNRLSGPLRVEDGNQIRFDQLAGTKMACEGQGSDVFLNALNKVTTFQLDKGTLKLLADGQEVMSLVKAKQ
jgi:heat shock protein HslJ